MASLGTVVIGGRRFPVSRVRLDRSSIVITFCITGPQAPFGGPVTVFGQDGSGISQGKEWKLLSPIPDTAIWECEYSLTMLTVESSLPTVFGELPDD